MDLAIAVERLEAAGTEQNRKIHRRHGALIAIGVRNPALRDADEVAGARA